MIDASARGVVATAHDCAPYLQAIIDGAPYGETILLPPWPLKFRSQVDSKRPGDLKHTRIIRLLNGLFSFSLTDRDHRELMLSVQAARDALGGS